MEFDDTNETALFDDDDVVPACIRAVVVSIGVCLEQFGHHVMSKAREAV